MVANGLASGRSSFYDLVHPTHTQQASEQAHAAIGSSGADSMAAAAAGAAPQPGAAAAAGPGSAGAPAAAGVGGAARPPPSQPVAITLVSFATG